MMKCIYVILSAVISLSLSASEVTLTYTKEELNDLRVPQLHQLWKQSDSPKTVDSLTQFCASVGLSLRPVSMHGKEAFEIGKEKAWYYIDPETLDLTLDLDNSSYVSIEELLDDPFLTIRKYPQHSYKGIKELASFSIIDGCLGDVFDSTEQSEKTELTFSVVDEESSSIVENITYDGTDFNIELGSNSCSHFHWQIASDNQFQHINIENDQATSPQIHLTQFQETFLNADETYFLRVKTYGNKEWTRWSKALSFTLDKPQAVSEYDFKKLGMFLYEITWNVPDNDENLEYLVFGSNALDFVPSIYGIEQVNEMLDDQPIDAEKVSNLIAVTKDPRLVVHSTLPYYRIVTRKAGKLGTPSPLIRVYDHSIDQKRTVLQVVDENNEQVICKRVELPGYSVTTKSYPYNSFVTREVWAYTQQYFLPENHPLKSRLDRLFSEKRVTLTPETFKKAGFSRNYVGRFSRIMASSNPRLEGIFVKAFSDLEPNLVDWQKLITRIEGAKSIQKCIDKHNFNKIFKVPNKWLYPLPMEPSPPAKTGFYRKNFILIADDVRKVSHDKNDKKYYSEMTKEILDALYIVIMEEGLCDSVYNFNIPFCKDGKLAFIDTEWHHRPEKTNLYKMAKFFNEKSQIYWDSLIKNGGPEWYRNR